MRARLLFLDLDGTVVGTNGRISGRVMDCLGRARAAGCEVVVCTGRNRRSAQRGAPELTDSGYGIVLNGAEVVRWETGQVLRRAPIPVALARRAVAEAHHAGLAPVCFGLRDDDRDLLTDGVRPLFPKYASWNAQRLVVAGNLEHELEGCPLSIAVYGTQEETAPVAQAWEEALDGAAAVFHGPTHFYECWYAQLNAADADKAVAAEAVAAMLGVPRERTLAIGDHVNDVKLLRWAGVGVCMGGGDAEVHACADYITGTLEDDGAADAIEHFVLGG